MLLSRLDLEAFPLHHGKVIRATEEHREGIELGFKSAEGHLVGVEVKDDPQTVVDSVFDFNRFRFETISFKNEIAVS